MAAVENNIVVEQGADYLRTLVIKDALDVAAPLDTGTAADFKMQVRVSEHGPLAATFDIAFTSDGSDGSLNLSLADTVINALDPDTVYRYDLFWLKPDGIRDKLLYGTFRVSERITRQA